MSVKLMAEVLDFSPYRESKLLVHLVLANHANDDGVCWPSNQRVAQQTRLVERTVRLYIAEMEEDGIIERSERPGHSNLIRVRSQASALGRSPASGGGGVPTPGGEEARLPQKGNRTVSEPLALVKSERNEMFDALADACGISPQQITKSGRGGLNTAVKQLMDVGATPEDIPRAAAAFKRKWPNIALTAPALCKHWAALVATQGNARERTEPRPEEFRPEPPATPEERARAAENLASLREAFGKRREELA